jgi:ERCC4-related helicase
MLFDLEEILDENFPSSAVERGFDYFRKNKVRAAVLDRKEWVLRGYVRGSRNEQYKVDVSVGWEPDSPILDALSFCACPVEFQCKHGVALIYHFAERNPAEWRSWLESTRVAPPDQEVNLDLSRYVDLKVATWLNQLSNHPEKSPRLSTKIVRYQLGWTATKTGGKTVLTLRIADVAQPGYLRNLEYGDLAQLGESDESLCSKIVQHTSAEDYGLARRVLSGERASNLLEDMVRTGKCFLDASVDPLVAGPLITPEMRWRTTKVGTFKFELDVPGKLQLGIDLPMYIDTATRECGRIELPVSAELIKSLRSAPSLQLEGLVATHQKLVALGVDSDQVLPHLAKVEITNNPPEFTLKIRRTELYSGSSTGRSPKPKPKIPVAGLSAEYGQTSINLAIDHKGAELVRQFDGNTGSIRIRSRQHELDAIFRLKDLGFVLGASSLDQLTRVQRLGLEYTWVYAPGVCPSEAESDVAYFALIRDIVPSLTALGWKIEVEGGFRFVPEDEVEWDIETRSEGEEWFKVDLGISVGGKKYPLAPFLIAALNSPAYTNVTRLSEVPDDTKTMVSVGEGKLVEIPAWRIKPIIAVLYQLFGEPENWGQDFKVSRVRIMEFADLEAGALGAKFRWTEPEHLRLLREKLKTFTKIASISPPESLQGTLRNYQLEGVKWLNFLQEFGFGGILADDMGLGKTVQTITHILLEKESGRMKDPVLIVAPTSTLPNWSHELQKFAPELKVAYFHGVDRKTKIDKLASHEVVLTSYAILNRDREFLGLQQFHLVVLDEAQNVKNPATSVFKAATSLRATHRLCLSGTPIENNLEELWALFNFAMPGLFSTLAIFRKSFRTPIERDADSQVKQTLSARIKPFILRRTKEQVVTELPPKTEIIERVELEGAQRDLYETLRIAMNEKVRALLASKGLNRSRIEILDALLKLRQVCCDPRLVKIPAARAVLESAKLTRLGGMLEELTAEGRRILVFSQFTSMLDLIEPMLKLQGLDWVRISGDTVDRDTPVKRFQSNQVPIFLISLRAGGTGLNLTAADVVIHYDPWWNPAVERQATDRAHRIGQDKSVFVYKLIAQQTVEEKILSLQERKSALAGAILSDDAELVSTLTAEDLSWIFS